tara:strand:- start:12159 stop:12989 length:831 start_codon:yes stop_codon:yes gene_type:complete
LVRPRYIFTFQAHPFVTLSALVAKIFLRKSTVIPDLHSAALLDHFSGLSRLLSKRIWENCPLIITHNPESKDFLSDNIDWISDRLFVLEDPISDFSMFSIPENENNKKLTGTFICRFSPDEPVQEFLKAIKPISDVKIFVTGNEKKAAFDITSYQSEHIRFTGFLNDLEYIHLLQNSDFVIVLTTREKTLLSGGYEALSLSKPLIVSDTQTLHQYFDEAVIFTGNKSDEIKNAIQKMRQELPRRKEMMGQLCTSKKVEWEEKYNNLIGRIKNLPQD